MKKHILVLLIIACLGVCEEITDDCLETENSDIEECEETEYQSYIECIRKRSKRSVGCGQSSCDSCDCNYCSSNICNNQCNACCANFQQPCETKYCCYKTCHSQCSNDGCRDTCRRTCTDKLTNSKETVIQQQPAQVPNITTIINLHNRINNTNIIDVPINLRTDNINNITINTGQFASNKTSQQKCCQVVSPRQCAPTEKFPFMRCFHLRKRVCGDICSANVMHAQPHQVCDQSSDGSQADCHNQVIYIPQPQPRCVYKSEWPYVNCNIPPANCEGCYDHYASNTPRPSNCPSSCYDDGYGVGPYYRQAPYYRPGYAPIPSCVQMGNCPYYPGYGGYPQMGGGYDPGFSEYNPMPVPFNGVGYPPSTYDNFYTVQRNVEVPDMSKLLINLTQNDDYDAQTLPITNSITHSSPPQPDPRLVKIETVNATDVFMTINEMNDEPVLEDDDVTVSPTSVYSSATLNPSGMQAGPDLQPNMALFPTDPSAMGQVPQTAEPTTILHPETGKIDPFGGLAAYDPVVRYQRDHNKVKKEDLDDTTDISTKNSTNISELKNSTIVGKLKGVPDENKKSGKSLVQHITITPIKKEAGST